MQPNWTKGQIIGHGSSATVSAAFDRCNGEIFAVKCAELSVSESLQREQSFLSTLSHPHIVNYKGFDITIENHKPFYNLHLEYIPITLFDKIKKSSNKLDEPIIRYYTKQVLLGLEYLHAEGIVHCDIKSKNLLVSDNGVKISDFGCSKWVDEAKPIGGTPLYMAPEVARGEEQGFACDIWALGCIIIEMATKYSSPWLKADDPVGVLYKIACSDEVPEIPGCLSEEARDFIRKCLIRDHKERWTAFELLQHPFMRQFGDSLGKRVFSSESVSPTSVLDQGGCWNSTEESTSRFHRIFPACSTRIGRLAMVSEEASWSNEGDWIVVRDTDGSEESLARNGNSGDDTMRFSVSGSYEDNYLDFQDRKIRYGGRIDAFTVCKYLENCLIFSSKFEGDDESLLLPPIEIL